MSDVNQTIFYTTAQVTEMVELSDQNVRKYVRLLEDREYTVAKDEHNRRLFSGNDIVILKELIVKAKQPGYTLETAADEVIEEVNNILTNNDEKLPSTSNDNDIMGMFSKVMDKLEVIQEENRDLKSNISNLVERLEAYDENSKQNYLEYAGENRDEENNESHEASDDITLQEDAEAENEDDEPEKQGNHSSDESKDAAVSENEEESSVAGHNVDMDQYKSESGEEESKAEKGSEKKGFFSGLVEFFKG